MRCDCCNQEKSDLITINAVACHKHISTQVKRNGNIQTTIYKTEYTDLTPVELHVSEGCTVKPWPRVRNIFNFSLWCFIFFLAFFISSPLVVPLLLPPSQQALILLALLPFFVSFFVFVAFANKFFLYSKFRKYRDFEKLRLENKLDQKTGKKYERLLSSLRSDLKRSLKNEHLGKSTVDKKDITNEEAILGLLIKMVPAMKLDKMKGWSLLTPQESARLSASPPTIIG